MAKAWTSIRWGLVAVLLAALATLRGGSLPASEDDARRDKPIISGKLPNVPGQTLTAILVRYAPGEKSPKHRHAGSVFAFVVSGSIRSENSATGPARVYEAGEGFWEPEGSAHFVSENASTTEPASLLAVFVAEDGATLTTFAK